MHFPSIRAHGYANAGVLTLAKTGQQHGKSAGSRSGLVKEVFTVNLIIMKLFFSNAFERKQNNEKDELPMAKIDESLHEVTEGSEFLDDAIRMIDQPFTLAGDSIAKQSQKGSS